MKTMDRTTLAGACLVAWLALAAVGVWDAVEENRNGGGEGAPYWIYTVVLVLAVALTGLWALSHEGASVSWQRAAMVFLGLAALSSIVAAWAIPLWAAFLTIGVGVLAAAGAAPRARLAAVAIAPLVGIAVMIAAIEAEVGPADEYGDYPVAFAIGVMAISVLTAAAIGLATAVRPAAKQSSAPALVN